MKIPVCSVCGKALQTEWLTDGSGIPAMVGFKLDDGRLVTVCRYCIEEIGMMNDEEQEEAIKKIKSGGLVS